MKAHVAVLAVLVDCSTSHHSLLDFAPEDVACREAGGADSSLNSLLLSFFWVKRMMATKGQSVHIIFSRSQLFIPRQMVGVELGLGLRHRL